MFKKKLIILSAGILLPFSQAFSQYAEDAILFSRHFVNGTARMQGMGGAQVALGGDVSNTAINPAGLGFFNRNEFTVSPAMNLYNTTTDYNGVISPQVGANLNFANIGIVFNNSQNNLDGPWRGGSFGVNFSRLNHYRNEFLMEGRSTGSSILDNFAESLNGVPPSELDPLLDPELAVYAYEQYLINDMNNNTYEAALGENAIPFQRDRVITRGSQNVWNFSYGGNFNDQFYIGAGLGITTLNYSRERRLNEDFNISQAPDPNELYVQNVEVYEDLRINGTGVNFNIGAIYRPIDQVRLGASIITPTYYYMNEEYFASLYSRALINNSSDEDEDATNIYSNSFMLTTPLRVNGGLAYFIGKQGFISVDLEYVDYIKTRLSSIDFSMAEDNQQIQDFYQSALNIRLGGEYRIDQYRLRAGYAHYGDPHNFSDGIDRSRNSVSLGAGIRTPNYFVDLALVHSFFKDQYFPYAVETFSQPVANVNNNLTNLVLTVGFNF